ncbi:MAG: metalloregulator ArsR/SmtB family transcription factor [Pseudomonadota bacterium]
MSKTDSLPDCCNAALAETLRADLFKALCDPVRISIVATLAARRHPATVSEIAECCGVDFSGVSRHLKILKDANVLTAAREGRKVLYWLDTDMLAMTLRAMADALQLCRADAA